MAVSPRRRREPHRSLPRQQDLDGAEGAAGLVESAAAAGASPVAAATAATVGAAGAVTDAAPLGPAAAVAEGPAAATAAAAGEGQEGVVELQAGPRKTAGAQLLRRRAADSGRPLRIALFTWESLHTIAVGGVSPVGGGGGVLVQQGKAGVGVEPWGGIPL
jgi:hypothetical protein